MYIARITRAGLALLPLLPLLAACDDRPIPPTVPASPTPALAVSPAATESLEPEAYVHVPKSTVPLRVIQNASSFNASGGEIHVRRLSAGHYQLRFVGLTDFVASQLHPQVTAQPDSTVGGHSHCFVTETYKDFSDRRDIGVGVGCYRAQGGAFTSTDMGFTVQLVDRDADAGYVTVLSDGTARNGRFFMGAERIAKGQYRVKFLPFRSNAPLAALVSAHNTRSCQLVGLETASSPIVATVLCHDAAGNPFDGPFHVLLVSRPHKAAYAIVRGAGSIDQPKSFNSGGGAIAVQRGGAGSYEVRFDGLGSLWTDDGTVHVTSRGIAGESCTAGTWRRAAAAGAVRVRVQCHGSNGAPANADFTVLALTKR